MLSLNHYFMQHIGRMEIKKAPNFFEAFYLVTQLGAEPPPYRADYQYFKNAKIFRSPMGLSPNIRYYLVLYFTLIFKLNYCRSS